MVNITVKYNYIRVLYIFFWAFPRRQMLLLAAAAAASDAGEIPKRKYRRFRTRRKFEIKNTSPLWRGYSHSQSAKLNLTPGKYTKENIQDSEHGENLKSSILEYIYSYI
jgi:hypothetical protein